MNFSFLSEYGYFYVEGTRITIILTIFTVFFGVIIGIILALMRLSKFSLLKFISVAYIEFIRGTPLLVQVYIVVYGLPQLGIIFPEFPLLSDDFPRFMGAVVALSINSGAYVAEIIRAGIQAVDKGQTEAARSLGMPYWLTMRYVVLPQAFKNILPALGNEFIVVLKESSIVSVIGIGELMFRANTIRGITFLAFGPLVVAALIYFVLTFSLSKLLGVVERRMRAGD